MTKKSGAKAKTTQRPAARQAANPLPKSDFFEKPDIEVADGEVLLFCTLKNEVQRIPYFLEYYRAQGINHFFMIDNTSTDGSRELLEGHEDVHLFDTEMSYKGSSAGRLWMQELAAHYGMGHWCLTVDVDELLVFPASDQINIPQMCDYLDHDGAEGLMCVFLDMYSDKPLSATLYEPGEPFTDVCCWFETDTYIMRPGTNPPFLSIFGGPRGKSFVEDKDKSNGPMMKKVPLVKWTENFTYIFSTHSHSHLRLARATGALLHFKFFDFFTELAAREHARGDRRQTQDYAHYASSMTEGVCFYGDQSRRYTSPADLVKLGVLAAPNDLREWCMSTGKTQGPAQAATIKRAFPKVTRNELAGRSAEFSLRDIARLWPFVNNTGVWDYAAAGVTLPTAASAPRERFLRQIRNRMQVFDANDTSVLVRLPEALLYQVNDPKLQLVCTVRGQVAWQVALSGNDPRLRVAERSLEPMTYRITCDWQPEDDGMVHDIAYFVVAEEQIPSGGLTGAAVKQFSDVLGTPISQTQRLSLGSHGVPGGLNRIDMDGVIDAFENGQIGGWIRQNDLNSWKHPIAIYLDGQFVTTVTPSHGRNDSAFEGQSPLGFKARLPLGYFYEQGRTSIVLEARVAGANVSLRRCPIQLDGAKTYRWRNDQWEAEVEETPEAKRIAAAKVAFEKAQESLAAQAKLLADAQAEAGMDTGVEATAVPSDAPKEAPKEETATEREAE